MGPFNGNPETCFVELTCTEYVYVEGNDDEFGGGSGDDLSSPEPCNSDGDLSGQLCIEGGGSVPTGAAIIENPCDQPNPPDYCSEAGSCFDANIGNAVHETILKVIEDQGALNQLWTDSNFDQSESNRLEQGGFLVPNSYNDGFTFQHLQPSQITQQTSCKLRFQAPSDLPNGTIYAHTHPYTNGEQQDYCDTPIPVEYENEVGVKDRPALQQMNLEEGLILDADKIIFYKADGNDSDGYASYDRCGY